MQADLSFSDKSLERLYQEQHAEKQRFLDVTFHWARGGAWAAVGIRAVLAGTWGSAIITLLGAITTVATGYAHCVNWPGGYTRWRPGVLIADNILQVALGCYTHSAIYPPIEPGSWRAMFVMVSGNGVAWLLFSSLWGSLVFQHMFPMQAVLVVIIMLCNKTLCRSSGALSQAYVSLRLAVGWLARTLLPADMARALRETVLPLMAGLHLPHLFSHAAGDPASADSAAVAAVAGGGAGEVCSLSDKTADHLMACLSATASGGAHSAACGCLLDGQQLCLLLQPVSLLLFGFFLPTFYIYARELQERRQFARCAESRGLTTSRWLPEHELGPGLIDYFLFGVPAIVCLCIYVVAIS